jgi:hypothetical protein
MVTASVVAELVRVLDGRFSPKSHDFGYCPFIVTPITSGEFAV